MTLSFPSNNKSAADEFENMWSLIWERFLKEQFNKVENTMEQCFFQILSTADVSQGVCMWERVNILHRNL